ncbi:hypothetical protein ACFW04_013900 [Cataglyphis niger]
MVAPTFVDLQGFIIGRNFIVKEVAILKNGSSWLIRHHHGHQWEDGNVPYSMAKRLITLAVMGATKEEDSSIVYVKRREKREWLADILDIASLNKLDVTNIMRCEKHLKNCENWEEEEERNWEAEKWAEDWQKELVVRGL